MSRIHECEIGTLHPTQITVGMIEVHDKREHLAQLGRHRLRDHLAENPMPAVIGPCDRLYITDHHHLGRALWDEGIETAFFLIEAELSDHSPDTFWEVMQSRHWVHPIDERGRRQPIASLPKHIDGLVDDPYRSLSSYVRNAGGYEKTPTPFAEFVWADFFRNRIQIGPRRADFERAVAKALVMAHSPAAKHLPGFAAAPKR